MSVKKDYVIFRLTRENEGGSMPHIKFPPNKSISAVQEIVDKDGEIRLIRYIPHEKSIFVDKQQTPFNWDDFRAGKGLRLNKPTFKEGFLVVNKSQNRLLEYMRHAKNNIENSEANSVNGWTFMELNIEKESREELDYLKRQTEVQHRIFTMEENDIKSIAVLMGLNYQEVFKRSKDEVQLAVIDLALQDIDTFDDILSNDLNTYKFEIIEALKLGIFVREGDSVIKWEDGVRAATASHGLDPVQVLAEKMITDKALTDALRNRIRVKKGGYNNFKSDEELIESSVDVLEGLTKTEVIDKAIQMNREKAGLLEKKGATFYLDDEHLFSEEDGSKGYEGAKQYLLSQEGQNAYNRLKAKVVIYLTK